MVEETFGLSDWWQIHDEGDRYEIRGGPEEQLIATIPKTDTAAWAVAQLVQALPRLEEFLEAALEAHSSGLRDSLERAKSDYQDLRDELDEMRASKEK